MSQTVLIKRSATTAAVPSTLGVGELAANIADMRLWIGTSSGVKEFGIVSTAALAWLSHVSVSPGGLPLWNGQTWGSPESVGIGAMAVGSTFTVG